MVKATFSLDDDTMEQIRRTAARLGKAQSHVVREAVLEYAARADRLSERERLQMLDVLEGLARTPVSRSARAVDSEIKDVRAARRRGGRRRP
jgi:predicted transcriptional regulator